MEKTFVLALIGAHFMMAIGLPEISMDKATSKFDWHRQRDSSYSTTFKCIYQPGFFDDDFTYIGLFKDEMCIVACTAQKKIDPRINGAIRYADSSADGCWCAKNTQDIIDNADFKSCVLETDGTKWRSDDRCGPKYSGAECNPNSINPCCASFGWCGNTKQHCSCVGCVDYRIDIKWRSDYKCGPKYSGAECNPNSLDPCCSDRGWCGSTKQHCSCVGCVDYRVKKDTTTTTTTTTSATTTTPPPAIGTKWRSDLRCGPKYSGAECNNYSDNPCCSDRGWCGVTEHHCSCVGCVDYRIKKEKDIKWRSDLRCGPEYSGAGCNPYSSNPCCAPSGWCGMTKHHCSCVGCVDYRIRREKVGSSFRKDPRSSFRKYHPRSSFRKDHLRSIFRKDYPRSTFRKDHHTDEGIRELI